MSKNLLLIAILLLTACTSEPKPTTLQHVTIESKDTKEMKALKIALSEYTQATIDDDVTTLISFIYPKAFKIVSKEKMETMLNKTFRSGTAPKVKAVKHKTVEPIKKYTQGLYSIITSSISSVVKSPRPDDLKFEKYMLKILKEKLASRGTVTVNQEKHIFNVEHINKTLAVNENGSWKFIGFKQAEKYISKDIFPIDLIDKLN